MTRLVARTAIGLVLASSVTLALATPAAADSAGYLQELDRVGVRYTYDAMDVMVQIGVAACNDIRAGEALAAVGANVANRGVGLEPSMSIILAATRNLCPEFFPETLKTAVDNGWVILG